MGRIGSGPAGRGSTLLEVVLAGGLIAAAALALAATQADALATARRAGQLEAASLLLQSLAAALRANPEHWAQVSGADIEVLPPASGDDWRATRLRGAPSGRVDCRRRRCSAEALAAFELMDWGADCGRRLPQARARIRCAEAAPAPCALRLQWQDGAAAASLQLAVWR